MLRLWHWDQVLCIESSSLLNTFNPPFLLPLHQTSSHPSQQTQLLIPTHPSQQILKSSSFTRKPPLLIYLTQWPKLSFATSCKPRTASDPTRTKNASYVWKTVVLSTLKLDCPRQPYGLTPVGIPLAAVALPFGSARTIPARCAVANSSRGSLVLATTIIQGKTQSPLTPVSLGRPGLES